jgi:hypothetical protein
VAEFVAFIAMIWVTPKAEVTNLTTTNSRLGRKVLRLTDKGILKGEVSLYH